MLSIPNILLLVPNQLINKDNGLIIYGRRKLLMKKEEKALLVPCKELKLQILF
jgi:hypothetical protein